MGQMLDLMSQSQGQRGSDILYKFTPALYQQIVRYKTAFYSFYLPFAGSMILCGFSSPDKLKASSVSCHHLVSLAIFLRMPDLSLSVFLSSLLSLLPALLRLQCRWLAKSPC